MTFSDRAVEERAGPHPIYGLLRRGCQLLDDGMADLVSSGGVLLLSEAVTLRLVVASAATLGGVALVLTQRNRAR